MAIKKGLGRGLDALLYDNTVESAAGSGVMIIKLADIEPNPEQARKEFDEEALQELCDSIKIHGLVQPIVVRSVGNGFYEIIAGERRWRACRMAGLTEIPCVVKDVDERTAAELSLIENLQRENLNPIEEAEGYRTLMETYGLTQETAAERVGKSRAAVANILRILRLPGNVKDLVSIKELSYGHARTLVPLCDKLSNDDIYKTAQTVINNSLSVRQTEQLVKTLLTAKPTAPVVPVVHVAYYKQLESRAGDRLGRHVSIRRKPDGSGNISLAYSSTDDLEALLKSLCGKNFFENEQ